VQEIEDAGPCPTSLGSCYSRFGCLRKTPCGQMPFGASVSAAMKAQIANGLGAQMVLYRYDFCDAAGPDRYKLNETGTARLADIAEMVPQLCYHPIVIERTRGNAALDAARRAYVVKTLGQMNSSIPEQLVVVGKPETRGLSGEESAIVHKNVLKQTELGVGKAGGGVSAMGASSGASASGSGSSGGGMGQ
jgi:hypothetical protein